MASSWVILLLKVVAMCVVTAQNQEPLTNSLLMANPKNCSSYYEFVPQLKYCPEGLVFNPKQQTCDWPDNVDCFCNGSSSSDSGAEGGNVDEGTEDNNIDSIGSGDCPTRGKCPHKDPLDHTVHLPHMRDCNLFCRCDHGTPKLDHCPEDLHFNPQLQVCDTPQSAGCMTGGSVCQPLSNNNRSHWDPPSCVNGGQKLGDTCRLVCKSQYELIGSGNITCTEDGWNGTMGSKQIPSCMTISETGEDLMNNINMTIGKKNNLLFILDESGSVGSKNFDTELNFVQAIISAFPLSMDRAAGVITFSSRAAVDIPIRESDTCNFLGELGKIRYSSGGTDILRALNLADYEITQNAIHNLTLIFLVTDGISTTEPTPAAQKIKARGHILFAVGVGGYDEKQLAPLSSRDEKGSPLFYGIKNFKVFSALANYLSDRNNNGTSEKC